MKEKIGKDKHEPHHLRIAGYLGTAMLNVYNLRESL